MLIIKANISIYNKLICCWRYWPQRQLNSDTTNFHLPHFLSFTDCSMNSVSSWYHSYFLYTNWSWKAHQVKMHFLNGDMEMENMDTVVWMCNQLVLRVSCNHFKVTFFFNFKSRVIPNLHFMPSHVCLSSKQNSVGLDKLNHITGKFKLLHLTHVVCTYRTTI